MREPSCAGLRRAEPNRTAPRRIAPNCERAEVHRIALEPNCAELGRVAREPNFAEGAQSCAESLLRRTAP
eukprot:15460821-Alexandrium_andersonii.AAC.1